MRKPITAPSAWRPADFADRDAYTIALAPRHLIAFDEAIARNRAAGRATEDVRAEDFTLDAIAPDLAAWRHEVLHGRGFVLLRGISGDRYSPDDQAAIFWGLGTHLGRAVSQSAMGDRIGYVTDVGGKDRRERAYRNSRELTMHTDRCDVIGMLCLVQAMRGGVSGYSSAHTIYNDILASRPELLEPLFAGLRYHRRGEELPGEPPITPEPVPVLSESEGELSVVFLRAYMEMAAKEIGTSLTAEQTAALDYFEAVAARPDVRLEFTLEPGEAIFFNNCVLLHNRTAFEDHPEPARRRHLLRLWLEVPGMRAIHPDLAIFPGEGVDAVSGRTPTYDWKTLTSRRG